MWIYPELLECLVLFASVRVQFGLSQRVEQPQTDILIFNIFEGILSK